MPNQEWGYMQKQIQGFENYLCSQLGEFSRNKKLLKLVKSEKGYLYVRLYKDAKQFTFRAHRLVYSTHVGKIPDGFEINHKNGVKSDNRVENLEVCTHFDNMQHAKKNGFIICRRGIDNKLSVAIHGVCLKSGEKLFFSSQADAKRYGFNQGCIQAVLTGKRTHHKGYAWFYTN